MPTLKDPFVTLRKAIDNQDVEAVQQFIAAHPNLNYNLVTANGLSALWWALNPPQGKSSSEAIVKLLLPVVNPTQHFAGWTPSQASMVENTSVITKLIQTAENVYVAPVRGERRNLAAIAEDAQNVHDATVVKLSKMNLHRLYQRYVKTENALNVESQSECEKEFRLILNAQLPAPQPEWKQPRFLNSVLAGLDYCFSTNVTFPISENPEISLSLAQLVTLNWHAVKDNSDEVLPTNFQAEGNKAAQSKANKIARMCATLNEIATAYGEGHPSCAGGSCIRMGHVLASSHIDVHNALPGEPLKGEDAQRAFVKFLGKNLENLSLTPKEYWPILRSQCQATSDEDEAALQHYLKENQAAFAKELLTIEEIEENAVKQNLSVLNDGDFPLKGHLLSRNLKEVFDVLFQKAEECKQFCGDKTPQTALEEGYLKLSEHLLETPFWKNTDDKQSALNFLKNWQYLSAYHSNIYMPITYLFSKKEMSEETKQFALACMHLTQFQKQQDALKATSPKLKEWLEHLTVVQINELIKLLNQTNPNALPNLTQPNNLTLLVECALRSGYCSYLQLDGIEFKDRDFRGIDFNRVNFDNAQFEGCDLRLTTWTGTSCKNLKIKNSLVPFIKTNENPDPNKIACELSGFCFLTLPIHPATLSATIGTEPFSAACINFSNREKNNLLMLAAPRNSSAIVTALLNSPHCSKEYVEMTNAAKQTALILAAEIYNSDCLEAILNSSFCSPDLLEKTDKNNRNALHTAVNFYRQHLTALLASSHCRKELLQQVDNKGNTALMQAVIIGRTASVNAIMASKHCTKELLEIKDNNGKTALMLAASMHHELIEPLLNSQLCSVKDVRSITPLVTSKKHRSIILLQIIDEYINHSIGFFQGEKPEHKEFLREAIKDDSQSIAELKKKVVDYVTTGIEINSADRFAGICKLLDIAAVVTELQDKPRSDLQI